MGRSGVTVGAGPHTPAAPLGSAAAAAGERVIAMDIMALLGFGPRTLFAALEFARRIHPPAPAS